MEICFLASDGHVLLRQIVSNLVIRVVIIRIPLCPVWTALSFTHPGSKMLHTTGSEFMTLRPSTLAEERNSHGSSKLLVRGSECSTLVLTTILKLNSHFDAVLPGHRELHLTAPFESSRLESSERQTWAASPGLRLPLRKIKKMH